MVCQIVNLPWNIAEAELRQTFVAAQMRSASSGRYGTLLPHAGSYASNLPHASESAGDECYLRIPVPVYLQLHKPVLDHWCL